MDGLERDQKVVNSSGGSDRTIFSRYNCRPRRLDSNQRFLRGMKVPVWMDRTGPPQKILAGISIAAVDGGAIAVQTCYLPDGNWAGRQCRFVGLRSSPISVLCFTGHSKLFQLVKILLPCQWNAMPVA